tara:strand:- start:588 stop:851 length:264 start_codon:yes stop_codon:yes gene_type:complete
MENKNSKTEITPNEALIDGLSFITQKLYGFVDGKRTNFMPVSELLVTLALPQDKKENDVNSEDVFIAVGRVLDILDSMQKRRDSELH